MVVCSTALALGVGFVPQIGYILSLSRIFVFAPFFLMGVYLRKNGRMLHFIRKGGGGVVTAFLALVPVSVLAYLLVDETVTSQMMYGSSAYDGAYTIWIRAFLYGVAVLWILFFLRVTPRSKLRYLSVCGANTMPIYLVHGFLTRWAERAGLFSCSPVWATSFALLMAVGCLFLLGNSLFAERFNYFCSSRWYDRLRKGKKNMKIV